MQGKISGKDSAQCKGALAEQWAAEFLVQQGLRLVTRNYRCRCGEVDLIAWDRDTLVFIEVRLRSNNRWASAAESIDLAKQRRLRTAARHYLMNHQNDRSPPPCRFDAVLMQSCMRPLQWLRDIMAG